MHYPFSIKINKCRGSCNNISNRYARLCVPEVVKNVNVNLKVFSLILWSNQTKQIKWHRSCKCCVNEIKVFVTINKNGIKVIGDVNVKN